MQPGGRGEATPTTCFQAVGRVQITARLNAAFPGQAAVASCLSLPVHTSWPCTAADLSPAWSLCGSGPPHCSGHHSCGDMGWLILLTCDLILCLCLCHVPAEAYCAGRRGNEPTVNPL